MQNNFKGHTTMLWWAVVVWLIAILIVLGTERLMARDGHKVFDSIDGASIIAYVIILIFAPLAASFILFYAVVGTSGRIIRKFRPEKQPDPLEKSPDGFAAYLVSRRCKVDHRLEPEAGAKWPMFQIWASPDAMILDVVDKYQKLHSIGMPDRFIWDKLETCRADFGGAHLEHPCSIRGYIEHRLAIEDPEYLALGDAFLRSQLELCEEYVRRRSDRAGQTGSWPPLEWLEKRITQEEYLAKYGSVDRKRTAPGGPVHISTFYQERKNFEFLMLPGDEVWTYSSPPETWQNMMGREGFALVRVCKPIADIVTKMN